MHEHMQDKIERTFFFGLLILVAVFLLILWRPFLSVLVLTGTLVIIFWPVRSYLLRFLRGRRTMTAILCLLFVLIVVLVPISLFSLQVVNEATSFYQFVLSDTQDDTTFIDRTAEMVSGIIPGVSFEETHAYMESVLASSRDYASQAVRWFLQNVGALFVGAIQAVIVTFIFIISLFYFFRDGDKLVSTAIKFSPLRESYDKEVFGKVAATIKSVIIGAIMVAVLHATVATIGFTIFGIPNAFLWASVVLIVSLVPGVGVIMVIVPATIFLYIVSSPLMAIGMLVWGLLSIALIDNILSPRIIGGRLKIHPLLILLSVIGGLMFFGPAGYIIGPVVLGLFLALMAVYPLIVEGGEVAEDIVSTE